MTIRVRLFAILREQAGQSEVTLDVPAAASAADAVAVLLSKIPAIAPHVSSAAIAVNRAYAPLSTLLNEGDELALIPPVSGG